jgi:hypothetical protein
LSAGVLDIMFGALLFGPLLFAALLWFHVAELEGDKAELAAALQRERKANAQLFVQVCELGERAAGLAERVRELERSVTEKEQKFRWN